MSEKTAPIRPTSAIIDALVKVRDERRQIADRDKVLVKEWKSLEEELLGRLDEQGMLQGKTAAGTASVTEVIVPNVVDWDVLQEHIRKTGDFHLLQKRPAAAAFRELHASGETIPGMEPFNKRTISLRKK
jgi:transposase